MAFNSLQHLHDYASKAALFACVRKHLGYYVNYKPSPVSHVLWK
jgi:hypothetical protein